MKTPVLFRPHTLLDLAATFLGAALTLAGSDAVAAAIAADPPAHGVDAAATAADGGTAQRTEGHGPAPGRQPILCIEIGAKATAQYSGDGLTISAMPGGARLRCVFQRLEGEATSEGLWLVSTATNAANERFRVVAASVGRSADIGVRRQSAAATPLFDGARTEETAVAAESGVALRFPPQSKTLPVAGNVAVYGQTVRFTRPGLMEEYSVSMDGVRQDFVVMAKPVGTGELDVQLAVSGARVEQTAHGAQLVLEKSGRKIAYSRLRVTDATGRELPSRMELWRDGEAQRDSIVQPRVASPRATLGQADREETTLKGLRRERDPGHAEQQDTTPLGLNNVSRDLPRVARRARNPGLADAIPSGLSASATEWRAKIPPENLSPTLAVVVNDAEAVYPVRIDPTFSDANWISMGGIPGANGEVYAAVVDGSGNLYIGGRFTVVGDALATNIAKWDGSSWSALGSGMNSAVSALAVSGSDLYAGGFFTTAGGSAANRIAKWNGSSWSALGSGMNNKVSALAVSGSDLYAGGHFFTAGGSPADYIAKWNGSSWSALGSGMNSAVWALAVSGSDLYAGGYFTTAGGSAAIAKWNGSSWSALGSGMGGVVNALAVSGSDLYAGGGFTTAGGSAANRIAKWNGSSWSALASGMNNWVYALAVSGSDLYAGGYLFTTAGGSAANSIAKWNGSSWSALGSGMGGGALGTYVSALAVSGSDLYAGGLFTIAGGRAANHIAKWNGSSWSAVGSGMSSAVNALAVSGSDLYAGGAFTTAGGSVVNRIAKWNGSSWSALGSGMNSAVWALAVSGSDLYAGGSFQTAGGSAVNRFAKWNGSSWSALGSGMSSAVNALAVSGSDLYAGGLFTRATNSGGVAVTVNRIAKWNGSSWTALGSGMNEAVYALAVSGSDLYAGGLFTIAGGRAANYIAKWNGSSWSALGSGMDNSVLALAVSGTDLYAGGFFTTAGGSVVNGIAKWNGSSWSALGSGMNSAVYALAVSGSDLYAGGGFTTAGGKVSAYLARAYLERPALSMLRSGGEVTLSWPVFYEGFELQQNPDVTNATSWSNANYPLTTNGAIKSATLPIAPSNQFFRLIGN